MQDDAVVIDRHAVSANSSNDGLSAYSGRIARTLSLVREDGVFAERDFRDLERFAISCAGYASVVGSNSSNIGVQEFAALATRAALLRFRSVVIDDSGEEVTIGDVSAAMSRRNPGYSVTTSDWIQAMSEAGAVNQEGGLDDVQALLDYPQALLAQADRATDSNVEYFAAYRGALRSVYLAEPMKQVAESILETVKLADNSDDWQIDIEGPALDTLWGACAVADEVDFNKHLAKALVTHRHYWSGSDELLRAPEGFIAWRLLPIVKLARARGLELRVSSPYLPEALIAI